MTVDAQTPVGQIVAEDLLTASILDRFGIDYCCGGRNTLGNACAERGLDVSEVLHALEAGKPVEDARPDRIDYASMPLGALADQIVAAHHAYLREALPRLNTLLDKVVAAHSAAHPDLFELRGVFHGLKSELELHMMKEENVLFPLIKELEAATSLPMIHCGSVNNPIMVMEHEHDSAGVALGRLRQLSNQFTPPPDACPTYRAMLQGLADLEADLHRHIHKENNILFPKAAALEAALRSKAAQA